MRRVCRWLNVSTLPPSNLPVQRRQFQPTDLKAKAVGAAVRELREGAGHSQERLSGECGFDRTYISQLERGIINLTVSRLWKIADALKTPLSQTDGTLDCVRGAKAQEAELRIGSGFKTAFLASNKVDAAPALPIPVNFRARGN